MGQRRYRAFISYSHHDRAWGEWLHKALENYRVPRRLVGRDTGGGWIPSRLTPVFRDQDELPSASDLREEVATALANSDNLIVVCSPAAAASRWVNREVFEFKRLGRSDRIFCLVVAGEPVASRDPAHAGQTCFPQALLHALGADGRLDPAQPVEPMAADARPEADGRQLALHKLIAGLLGVGVDELRQRERARRHWRTSVVVAGSLLLAVVMTVLGVQAILARQAAERRQQQAEALVGYMLGDLADKLDEVNRLDILAGVADKAMQYFTALPPGDLGETGQEQRVLALQKIGSVRLSQGHADTARTAFDAALKLSRQLATRSPDDIDRQLGYADSLNWIGFIEWQQGRTDTAAERFQAAHAVLAAIRGKAPDSPQVLSRIKDVATNRGRILEGEGKLDAAEGNYREVLEAVQRLRQLQPDQQQWQVELGFAYNNLGLLQDRRGKLRQAVDFYSRDLAIKRKLGEKDPRNMELRSGVAVALMFIARLRGELGAGDAAIEAWGEAAAIYDTLQATDPGNVDNSYYLGLARLGLARQLLADHRDADALDQATQARLILQHAADSDSGNPKKAMRAQEAGLVVARLALRRGERRAAATQADQIERALAGLDVGKANLAEVAQYRAIAALLVAEATGSTDKGSAQLQLQHAHALLQPHIDADTRDPVLLDTWLRIAAAMRQAPFPERELRALAATGYADPGFIAAMRAAGIAYRPAPAGPVR